MVFASPVFLFGFFPIFYCIFYILGIWKNGKIQNLWILIGSLVFYSWGGVWALLILLLSILVNYCLGILIEDHISDGKAKVILKIALFYNVLVLIFFKYTNFLVASILTVFGLEVPSQIASIPLPIGISFYTFQIISYIVDVYKRRVKAQRNIINLGVYVALFPQLIAGPIVRYIDIDKEIKDRKYDIVMFGDGLERFIYGLTKKLLIADVMGKAADYTFNNMAYDNSLIAWVGIVAYAFQIYFDFSAYSDMAIGMGKMMGFHFLENFNYPYISLSVKEFWRRWHISLSSWFRDYVYIPLGGNRIGKTERNLMIVFFLTGLWHGASWNFIVWGLWHGMFLLLERHMGGKLEKVPKIVRWLYTFMCVEIGWVFFRADNLMQAMSYLRILFSFNSINFSYVGLILDWQVIICFVASIILSFPISKSERLRYMRRTSFVGLRVAVDLICYVLCIFFILGTKSNPFIYFKF